MHRPRTLVPPILAATVLAALCAASVVPRVQDPAPAKPGDFAAEYARAKKEMKAYAQVIDGTDVTFDMVPIPGGTFSMGSPDDEDEREDHEGPQHRVRVDPFWIGKCEVTWEEYEQWCYSLERDRRPGDKKPRNPREAAADAVTRPTPPYTDMTFDMGREGFPAICMTQLAAKKYCEWLSKRTGRFYRLPTEAEWEYACRAGTTTPYHCGDDVKKLREYAWFEDNAGDGYRKVGTRKPNAWGVHDMHGNVAEWTLDALAPYAASDKAVANPFRRPDPEEEYGRVVRGGSWFDAPDALRSAARLASVPDWKEQDPQIPQSIWYLTDADFVGFRVVRPFKAPKEKDRQAYWEN